MKPLASLVLLLTPALLAGGCADDESGFVILQNQLVNRAGTCLAATSAGPALGRGVLDVGIVASGRPGYTMYPLVVNNLTSNKGLVGTGELNRLQITGFEIELQVPPALAAGIPLGQRKFFEPVLGGSIAPGEGTAFGVEVIRRQHAELARQILRGDEVALPVIYVRLRAVASRQSETMRSAWVTYPVDLCLWCLAGGKPEACPANGFEEMRVLAGSCTVAQDEAVTCCTAGERVLCGSQVPVVKK